MSLPHINLLPQAIKIKKDSEKIQMALKRRLSMRTQKLQNMKKSHIKTSARQLRELRKQT